MATIHQPKHRRTKPAPESGAVVIQFPGSDALSTPIPASDPLAAWVLAEFLQEERARQRRGILRAVPA